MTATVVSIVGVVSVLVLLGSLSYLRVRKRVSEEHTNWDQVQDLRHSMEDAEGRIRDASAEAARLERLQVTQQRAVDRALARLESTFLAEHLGESLTSAASSIRKEPPKEEEK